MKTQFFNWQGQHAFLYKRDAVSYPCGKHVLAVLLACGTGSMALANGLGDNSSWQFQSSTDKANRTVTQDMIQKRQAGMYAAPVYNTHNNTNIERQVNCTVSALATGNDNDSSAVANSPSNTGAQSLATGNDSANSAGSLGSNYASSSQGNSGSIGSSVSGGTTTQVRGSASQALNTYQGNSGSQSASVGSSTGCRLNALN